MQTHSRSTMKRNNKKSIRSHVDRILRSGFLSNDDSLLLKNTLELMKILSKIKKFVIQCSSIKIFYNYNYYFSNSVQNQINLQGRDREDEFGCVNKNDHYYPELHFLNNRLELLINQKNHCKILQIFNLILYLLIKFYFRFNQNWAIIRKVLQSHSTKS